MSVRAVWVIRPPTEASQKGTVLLSRHYGTVERRAKILSPSLYTPLPPDPELCAAVVLKCSEPTEEFVEERDSCSLPFQKPVYELLSGKLWPVVCIEMNGLLFVAAPLLECSGKERPPLIQVRSIPAAIALLEGMAEVLGEDTQDIDPTSQKIAELFQYLCLASPFGTPMETNPANLKLYLQPKKPSASSAATPQQKQPAWRPGTYKGSSKLHFSIREEVRAVEYDKPEIADVWEVYGTVQCKAELEGHPDILVTLTTPPSVAPLDHLIVHPCVQSADDRHATPNGNEQLQNRRIRFSAPLETFDLCHYKASGVPYLPIRGFYQMKGDRTVKLLVQLKLNEAVRNNFEYCEVHMPFFHRGPIERTENVSPTSVAASLSLSQDRRTLVWIIGQKFPSKTLELSLQATLIFPEYPPPTPPDVNEDPFCVGLNAYADLIFKIPDYTLSGVSIDTKSLTLFPSTKHRLTSVKELCTSQYRIWNSHGDAIATFAQLKDVQSRSH